MKNKLSLAFLVLFTLFALAFSVSNFVAPARASGAPPIYGTVTYCPECWGHPLNQYFHLYDDYFCLYDPSNCCVVH